MSDWPPPRCAAPLERAGGRPSKRPFGKYQGSGRDKEDLAELGPGKSGNGLVGWPKMAKADEAVPKRREL